MYSLIWAPALGVFSHLLFFVHGDPSIQSFTIARVYLVCTIPFLYKGKLFALSYFLGLLLSTVVYRLFFHRLRNFPGPAVAKVSKLYGLWMARDLQYYIEIDKFHDKYGDVVRVGPNELSLRSVDALISVHGSQSRCSKGPLYEVSTHNGASNQALIRNKQVHKERRKLWEMAFTSKMIKIYESRVQSVLESWAQQLKANEGKPMDISLWVKLITFDVMGEVGFSQQWGTVENGIVPPALHLLEQALGPLGKLGRITWLISLIVSFAKSVGAVTEFDRFANWSGKVLEEREADGKAGNDIMKPLIEEYKSGQQKLHDRYLLEAEAQAVTVAATDTVSCPLAFVFLHLATDPRLQEQLRQDLKPCMAAPTNSALSQLPLLEAVINETLRLHSPVAAALQRVTPRDGIQVGGIHIPGDVNVYTPFYSLGRDERYFIRAKEFVPERWTTSPELVVDRRASSAFGIGQYNCVGKQLALMEMRLLLARTISEYEVALAEEEDGKRIEEQMIDLLILKPGRLDVVFKKRHVPREEEEKARFK